MANLLLSGLLILITVVWGWTFVVVRDSVMAYSGPWLLGSSIYHRIAVSWSFFIQAAETRDVCRRCRNRNMLGRVVTCFKPTVCATRRQPTPVSSQGCLSSSLRLPVLPCLKPALTAFFSYRWERAWLEHFCLWGIARKRFASGTDSPSAAPPASGCTSPCCHITPIVTTPPLWR